MVGGEVRLQSGSVFAGDYRVVRPLAEGGMGAVYVVDQLSTGKARALKVMRPEIAHDADSRRRFELEARAGAGIESEHVVEIHSAGVDGGTPYIVMELLHGEDLATRVERTGPLSPTELREVFEQLCHAVAAAHVAGIVHRDLKPANVFLARSKRAGGDTRVDVKVLDFGIAKHVAESATRGQTMGMIGTPMWMAPEQTEPGRTTPAADVWALGLILYFVTTGHPYWLAAENPEATLTQLLKEVVMGPLPAASERARAQGAPALAPELDGVFARCVNRDPQRRYPNAQALWDALRVVLAPPSVRILTGAAADAGAGGATIAMTGDAAAAGGAPVATTGHAGGATGGAGGATVAAAPLPLPMVARASSPLVAVPPFPPAFHQGAGMSTTPLWKRLWPVPVALVAMLVLMQCLASARKAGADREVEQDRRLSGLTLTPAVGAPARPVERPATCRMCTTQLVVSGALSRDVVRAAFEAATPVFDQQCLGPRRVKRPATGTVTYAFEVKEGRATNRRIEGSTTTDGTDECLLRALSDLAFPPSAEPTDVTVTLAFNAALR
jgi:tRNA A-37 threonylcarbamoyl transferase component Bud32